MTSFKDHFSATASDYAAHRPTYPASLADFLAGIAPGRGRALDGGCGTGQLSVLLAEKFQEVVATDASAAQIAQATPHPRVRYRVATAERSGLEEASVDLVTVAQAAHWLDLPAFYDEVRRVARPGAALALISYGIFEVAGPPGPVMRHFYQDVVGPYWPPERRHVEVGYRSLPFPFPETSLPDMAIEVAWRLDDLLGYAGTWSAVGAARLALGQDPLAELRPALAAAWGDPQARRTVRWPLSGRIGHV
ncbi:class I SAM-dependent methyltransferase [Geminicoccus roseus]|uniref:class I SAM-dependent methyltransferase n=1 Tax=Geminicoccus roseus TaxID=404900 RepID=UPI0004056F24|nr:class I SAM-dependent methyltransferase [Geminicoccus roseus]